MYMKLIKTEPDETLFRIYEESFPAEERRDWHQLPEDDAFTLYGIYDDGDVPLGLLTAWDFGEFSYIEHFAIDGRLRGKGMGAEVLASVPGVLLIEVELPESGEMSRRRIAFYERNGFRLLDNPYVQPPYGPGLPEVPLRLMSRGQVPDIDRAITTLHSRVYGKDE